MYTTMVRSVASPSAATTDRCNGTLTEVGKGRVSLKVKGRKQPVTVRAGQAFFVRARLFAVKKGRKPPSGR